jgi:preprotein translocase subunit SecG
METFVTVVHIIVALVLISLVLLQDSKGGAGGAFGGGSSQSILGATGGTTLAQQLTRWAAVAFAGTCISLSMFATKSSKSVIDGAIIPQAAPIESSATPESTSTTVPTK